MKLPYGKSFCVSLGAGDIVDVVHDLISMYGIEVTMQINPLGYDLTEALWLMWSYTPVGKASMAAAAEPPGVSCMVVHRVDPARTPIHLHSPTALAESEAAKLPRRPRRHARLRTV